MKKDMVLGIYIKYDSRGWGSKWKRRKRLKLPRAYLPPYRHIFKSRDKIVYLLEAKYKHGFVSKTRLKLPRTSLLTSYHHIFTRLMFFIVGGPHELIWTMENLWRPPNVFDTMQNTNPWLKIEKDRRWMDGRATGYRLLIMFMCPRVSGHWPRPSPESWN